MIKREYRVGEGQPRSRQGTLREINQGEGGGWIQSLSILSNNGGGIDAREDSYS
jgi:hypothetical protein